MSARFESSALQTLQARGFLDQQSDAEAIDRAFSQGMVTFYVGYDPTATTLHVGNLVGIMAMRVLQRCGHKPIVLLGGGTARVGDPSGKTETRKLLDEQALDVNVAGIGRQFAPFLHMGTGREHDAIVVDNAQWLLQWRYVDFLREIGSHFTVNRMIATKTYRDRLDNEQPLSFLEFNYQLLQAYDFLHLYRTHGCRMQAGGSDQWGNIVAGIELCRRVLPEAEPALGLTWPLLLTADGRKMGKTEKGSVWLDASRYSPDDYSQYWISCADADVRKLLLQFTDLPVPEIDELTGVQGAALRTAKERLAFEATALAHGAEAAEAARAAARQAFGGGEDWSAVPQVRIAGGAIKLVDLVVDERIKAFPSKRQARQRIESGAVRIDGEPCLDPERELRGSDFADATLRLQAGKKTRVRVVLHG
jgi:tyrosyl-tRNA synthetase